MAYLMHMGWVTREFQMTNNNISETQKATKDNSDFKRLVYDCVTQLELGFTSICFYDYQVTAIKKALEKKGIEIAVQNLDGYYLLTVERGIK